MNYERLENKALLGFCPFKDLSYNFPFLFWGFQRLSEDSFFFFHFFARGGCIPRNYLFFLLYLYVILTININKLRKITF